MGNSSQGLEKFRRIPKFLSNARSQQSHPREFLSPKLIRPCSWFFMAIAGPEYSGSSQLSAARTPGKISNWLREYQLQKTAR